MSVTREKEMARIACRALEEKKGSDIKIIDIHQVSVIADYFIIASGSNQNQVQAMVDNVEEQLGRQGIQPKQIEGAKSSSWILMDYGDVIIHVFDEENRLFYDLERIWRDGNVLELKEFLED
ncbi:MAG: ribosome silencing factor [Eubacteriales bacterium]|nr:ribosome silencing factor [Eubacteriales bacterium]